MDFKFFTRHPSETLQPFVYYYVSIKGNHRTAWRQNLIPSNMQNLGFIFSGAIRSSLHRDWSVTRSFVVGQMEIPVTIDFREDIDTIIVFLKPTGMYRLFGIPMQQFTNRSIDFESVCSRQDSFYIQRIFDSTKTKQRIVSIEAFLLQRLSGKPAKNHERIEYASCLILDTNGNISIDQLARKVNMSKRNLQRSFNEQIGVSPKSFSGIVRFRKVLQLIERAASFTWKEIAQTLEYTDYAHFSHEFKKFTGKTPNEYIRSITDFEHFLYAV